MSEAFSQELCSMEPFKDGIGWVMSRPRTPIALYGSLMAN
jgi:hypothetical protein